MPGQSAYRGRVVDPARLAAWLQPGLNAGSRTSHLAGALRGLILDGRVVPGARLPAERSLAVLLGVSRSTVTAAYDQLRGEAFLVSVRGGGTFADLPSHGSSRPDRDNPAAPRLLDLTVAALPAPAAVADAAEDAAAWLPALLGGTGLDPAGLPDLREEVAGRYTARGLPTSASQVLITSGALHGWDLLLRAFTRPGAHVVVEQPTYPAIIDAAMAHRLRLHSIPVDAAGWDPAQLPQVPVAVAHLTFDGQNPTGAWADDDTRRRVLAAFTASTIVVVDETMLHYRHTAAPATSPGPALAPSGTTVLAAGSMSKSFWAGLRVGWIRGPGEVVRRLTAVRAGQDLAPPVLDQLLAAALLRRSDAILPERRMLVAARRDALLSALQEYCPTWSTTPPAGGLAAWVDLGGGSSTRLAASAQRHGLRVTPGPRFTLRGSHDRWLRLPFVLPPEQLHDVVRRLADAAVDLQPAAPRRRQTAATAWTA